MKKKDAEDRMELCPHQCIEMERYSLNVTWKKSFSIMFWAAAVLQGSISSIDNTASIKSNAVSVLCLSAEAAWQPPQARSWPDSKSWLSPVSY